LQDNRSKWGKRKNKSKNLKGVRKDKTWVSKKKKVSSLDTKFIFDKNKGISQID